MSVVGRGFAEIIEACPDEFPEDPAAGVLHFEFAVGRACPRRKFEVIGGAQEIFMKMPFGSGFDREEVFAARADCGRRFAAVLRDMRIFRVEFGVAVRLVVPADDVERGRKVVFHRVVGAVESGCDGTGRVGGVCDGGKFRGDFPSVRLALFVDFVADAPHDDRGVIAVAADQVDEVALVPFGIEGAVVVDDFSVFPCVERLIEHGESHAVAEIEKFRILRVVRGADGIAADALQQTELAFDRGERKRRAERTEVMMQADSFEVIGFAVQEHPFFRIETDSAEAVVDGAFVLHRAVFEEREAEGVKLRRFGRPEAESGEGECCFVPGKLCAEKLVSGGVGDGEQSFAVFAAVFSLNADFRGFCIRIGRAVEDADAGIEEVFGFCDDESRFAVDSRAGIPAGRLFGIRDPHGDGIFSAEFDKAGDVELKRCVAVGASARIVSVHINRGAAHDAVEFEEEAFSALIFFRCESETVPADADVWEAAGASVVKRFGGFAILDDAGGIEVVFFVERAADSPVMRNGDGLPGGVVERRRGKRGVVGELESPAGFENAGNSHICSLCPRGFPLALTRGFIEENGGGCRDVQGIHASEHRDDHADIRVFHPVFGESVLFRADNDRDAPGHVDVGVGLVRVRACGERADVVFPEPFHGLFAAGFGERDGEDRAGAGADAVGVEHVGLTVADDHAGRADGVRAAEHGTEVSGLLDGFRDEIESVGDDGHFIESLVAHLCERDESFGAVAVRHFDECVGVGFVDFRALGFGAGDEFAFVFAEVKFRAVVEFSEPDSRIHGAGEFAVSFENGYAFAVAFAAFAEGAYPFDFRVFDAGYEHRKRLLPENFYIQEYNTPFPVIVNCCFRNS